MTSIPKVKRIRDSRYLKFIRTLPCIFSPGLSNPCDKADAHHVIPKGWGKMGSKVDDDQAVPLCRLHHQMAHDYPYAHGEIIENQIPRLQAAYRQRYPKPRVVREPKPRMYQKRLYRRPFGIITKQEGLLANSFETVSQAETWMEQNGISGRVKRCHLRPEGMK